MVAEDDYPLRILQGLEQAKSTSYEILVAEDDYPLRILQVYFKDQAGFFIGVAEDDYPLRILQG